MVAGLTHYGVLTSVVHQIICWFITSLLLVLFLRSLVLRFLPSDHRYQPVDDHDNALGSRVQVMEEILPGKLGRISFRGTTWQATGGDEDHYQKGAEVAITGRKGNTWCVGPLEKNN